MPKELQQILIGMTAGRNYCIGFSPPIDTKDIRDLADENGLQPFIEPNVDGTQTVGYQRVQFGFCDGTRWQCFENYAERVKAYLARSMLEYDVVLCLEPVILELGQTTSLYANQEVAAA